MGGKIFKQETGSEERGCCMGKDTRADAMAARRDGGSGSGLGKHVDKAGCLVAPPTPYFEAQDHQTISPVARKFWVGLFLGPPCILQCGSGNPVTLAHLTW